MTCTIPLPISIFMILYVRAESSFQQVLNHHATTRLMQPPISILILWMMRTPGFVESLFLSIFPMENPLLDESIMIF
jgi:hypothetical protein